VEGRFIWLILRMVDEPSPKATRADPNTGPARFLALLGGYCLLCCAGFPTHCFSGEFVPVPLGYPGGPLIS
jgi:hypothetical protein